MGFWNQMAYAIRNTRAAIAAVGMVVVLMVLLYGRWTTPEVVDRRVLVVPVLAVERESEGAHWIRVVVETPEDGVLRLLWREAQPQVQAGAEVPLAVIEYADGRRDYRLLARP